MHRGRKRCRQGTDCHFRLATQRHYGRILHHLGEYGRLKNKSWNWLGWELHSQIKIKSAIILSRCWRLHFCKRRSGQYFQRQWIQIQHHRHSSDCRRQNRLGNRHIREFHSHIKIKSTIILNRCWRRHFCKRRSGQYFQRLWIQTQHRRRSSDYRRQNRLGNWRGWEFHSQIKSKSAIILDWRWRLDFCRCNSNRHFQRRWQLIKGRHHRSHRGHSNGNNGSRNRNRSSSHNIRECHKQSRIAALCGGRYHIDHLPGRHHQRDFYRQGVTVLHRHSYFSSLRGAWCAAHDGLELAVFFVIDKQFFRQHRLVIQHVDQKTQRTDVIAQVLKGSCGARQFWIRFSVEHFLDTALHPKNSLAGLVQSQYRQNTAHLR